MFLDVKRKKQPKRTTLVTKFDNELSDLNKAVETA